MMNELIYKNDVIKAICEDGTWLERQGCTEITMAERKQRDVDIIESLPPVQLGTNLAEVGTDLVSKQAAIDALTTYIYNVYKVVVGKTLPAEDCGDAAESVLDELPTVQPTQTSCEYCHTDRDGYVFPLEKNSHAFIDRDKIVLKANGWRGEAKIKYCPICGRRLTDG